MKKILILFDGPHLAFSPTPTQLYDALSQKYAVTIIAQDPENFTGQAINDRNVMYHKYYSVKGRVFYRMLFEGLKLFNKEAKNIAKNKLNYRDYFFRYKFIKKEILRGGYDRIICIDIANLFFCSMLHKRVDFLSLELTRDEHLWPAINKSIIDCVIIQSIERFEYLFKQEKIKTFLIQNAPDYKDLDLDIPGRRHLIYAGSALDAFGFYHTLRYLKSFPDETMVVQGAVLPHEKTRIENEFPELLSEKRLLINTKYLDNNDVVNFIADFEIGFCFYNFEDPMVKNNYFNYYSAPSGKMFKYLAAGVPVVAINILGFHFVNKYDCGILVDDMNAQTIREAIMKIRANYNYYVANAISAAKDFSFNTSLQPYLEFIDKTN